MRRVIRGYLTLCKCAGNSMTNSSFWCRSPATDIAIKTRSHLHVPAIFVINTNLIVRSVIGPAGRVIKGITTTFLALPVPLINSHSNWLYM